MSGYSFYHESSHPLYNAVFETDRIYLEGKGAYTLTGFGTQKAIDLTNYSKIEVECQSNNAKQIIYILIDDSKSMNLYTTPNNSITYDDTALKKYSVDISEFTSNKYLAFTVDSFAGYIYSIKLIK